MNEFLSRKLRFVELLVVAGALTCISTVTGFASAWWWVFDLTCHFRLQYAVLLIVLSIVLLPFRRFLWAIIFAAFAVLNLTQLLPFWLTTKTTAPTGSRPLKVLLMNVRTENARYDLVLAEVRAKSPDLVLLEETNARWLTELRALTNDYLYSVTAPREDNFGIALFSRLPLENGEVLYLGSEGVPSVKAEVVIGATNILFVGTHPLPPVKSIAQWYRNEQLFDVARYVARSERPVVLLGDLNVTPWSAHFRTVLRESKLKNTAQGFGIQPSWPSHLLPMRIPIDHCLISPSLHATDRRIGPNVGSDHFPVFVEIAIPQ